MYRSETYNWKTPVALPFSTIYWQYCLPCPSKITLSPNKARQEENTKIQFCLFSWHSVVLFLGMCTDWGWGMCLWYPGVAGMRMPDNASHNKSVKNIISHRWHGFISDFEFAVHALKLTYCKILRYGMLPAAQAVAWHDLGPILLKTDPSSKSKKQWVGDTDINFKIHSKPVFLTKSNTNRLGVLICNVTHLCNLRNIA